MLDSNTKKDRGIKVLSCFDGISCARVALERAGIPVEVYFASEIDKYAIQVSQKNYPDILQVGDVKDLQGHLITKIDLLIAGFPCQSFSIAGNRKGLDDPRGQLVWELIRIIKEVKPKHIILENVASMKKEIQEFLRDEFEKALGRKVYKTMVNASLVSAQNRKRIFFTDFEFPQPEDREILLKDILEENVDEKYYFNNERVKYVLNRPKNFAVRIDPEKTNTLRTNYGNASANETYVTQRIGQIGKGGQGDRIYSPEGKTTTLSALGGGRGAKTGLYAVASRTYPRIPNGEKRQKQIEIRKDEKSNALTSVTGDSMVMEDTQVRKLTPIECERLQGLEDNFSEGVSNTQRYKCLGNAFNVDVVSHILSFIKL